MAVHWLSLLKGTFNSNSSWYETARQWTLSCLTNWKQRASFAKSRQLILKARLEKQSSTCKQGQISRCAGQWYHHHQDQDRKTLTLNHVISQQRASNKMKNICKGPACSTTSNLRSGVFCLFVCLFLFFERREPTSEYKERRVWSQVTQPQDSSEKSLSCTDYNKEASSCKSSGICRMSHKSFSHLEYLATEQCRVLNHFLQSVTTEKILSLFLTEPTERGRIFLDWLHL